GALKDVDYLNLCCRGAQEPLEAQLCAVDVELSIAGCTSPMGKKIEHAWQVATLLVNQASQKPLNVEKSLRHATRVLIHMQTRARKLGSIDMCGDTLGLIAGHAIASIQRVLQ